MKEITFTVFKAEEGGYYARAWGVSIFTQAETLDELKMRLIAIKMMKLKSPNWFIYI